MEPYTYSTKCILYITPTVLKPLTYRPENLDYLISCLFKLGMQPIQCYTNECLDNISNGFKDVIHVISEWCCSIHHVVPTVLEPLAYCTKEACYPVPNLMAPIREPLAYCTKYLLYIMPSVLEPSAYCSEYACNAPPGF